ncbi:hypothetical protein [Brucella microti]|uniref:hypothetical protein n=1 Tax=Brucella microti TaxID=444163 RepID=UPI000674475B|nr:hypothetical protein [Brucella microti]
MTDATQNPCVLAAARWLAQTPDHEKPHPIIPAMRQRFGLTALEAAQAAADAALIRARAV